MSKNLFITGISGFIGRHVARAAIERGYKVSGMDIVDYKIEGTKIHIGDITDKEAVMRAMKGADYVIHLAAITSNVPFRDVLEGCYDINVGGFINVIDAAAKLKCKKFVYASSSAVYIDEFSEETKIDINRQENHYARTKTIDEMIARSFEDIYGIKTVGLRYFNTYGPTGEKKIVGANMVNVFIQNKRDHQPLILYGDGKQARDFLYIDDAVNFTLGILESGEERVYNIGSGKATKFVDIAKLVDASHIKYVKNPFPSNQYQFYTMADTRRLLKLFKNYKFVDLREGIKRSDFIRIALLCSTKPEENSGQLFSEYAYHLSKNLQPLINGKVDLISALGKANVGGQLYAHSIFGNKLKGMTKNGYDVIHITNQELGFLAKILKQSGNQAKIITTIHDVARLNPKLQTGQLQKMYNDVVKASIIDALEYSDYIIFDSTQVYHDLNKIIGVKSVWSSVPIGISDKALLPGNARQRESHKQFTIGYVGSLSGYKNTHFILDVAKKLGTSYKFLIHGEGEDHSALVSYKNQNGLENVHISNEASQNNLDELYQGLDVFIYPSLYSGFSYEIVEAQARGIPVIIYKDSDLPKENRKHCFEAKDASEAAAIIKKLREKGYDEEVRMLAVAHSRSFTWVNTTRETLEIYKKIIR